MNALLKGSAFITGAGSGIGQATAYALARYGVKQLAICDISPESLKRTSEELRTRHGTGVEILNIEMDTSNEDSVDSAINETVKAFSRVDYAVNNAGVGGTYKSTIESDFGEWKKVIDTNLHGVWLCQRAQLRQMLKQEPLIPTPRGHRGVIVNVTSMFGLIACPPATLGTAYTASKFGVMGLTKADAAAFAPRGVRINAICPGYVGTPLLKSSSANAVMGEEVAKIPQGRMAESMWSKGREAPAFVLRHLLTFLPFAFSGGDCECDCLSCQSDVKLSDGFELGG